MDLIGCSCPHPPAVHDDGFGCTEPGCYCLGRWQFTSRDHELASQVDRLLAGGCRWCGQENCWGGCGNA